MKITYEIVREKLEAQNLSRINDVKCAYLAQWIQDIVDGKYDEEYS